MTRKQFSHAAAVVLEALSESDDGIPSGHLYAALQRVDANLYTLDAYQSLLRMLGGYVAVSASYVVTITDKGRTLMVGPR